MDQSSQLASPRDAGSSAEAATGRGGSARAILRRLLREPLTHFLGISAILFFGLAAYERPDDSIAIDRAALVQFMQERARIFDEETFAALYDRLTPAERGKLVHEYAMSEALYRTAKASSLEQADPLIRQRMIQQMRLLLQDQAASRVEIGEAETRDHFEKNRQDYAQPDTLSFTHVFVDRRKHGDATVRMAQDLLNRLRRERVTFERAGNYGDLFPYRRNYFDVSRQQVAEELGERVVDRLFSPQVAANEWQGPFGSDLGEHLVLIAHRRLGGVPSLEEVIDRVREDALFARRELETARTAKRLLGEFRLDLARDVGAVDGTAR